MRFYRIDNTLGDRYIITREEIFRGASHKYKVVIYTVAREESNKTSIILCRHSPRSLANSRAACKEYTTFDLLPHPSFPAKHSAREENPLSSLLSRLIMQ